MLSDGEFEALQSDVSWWDMESVIKFFWVCSIENRMDEFDFDQAFEPVVTALASKLNEHGLLERDGCIEAYVEIDDGSGLLDINEFAKAHSTNYIYFSPDELKEALYGYMCDKAKKTFGGYGSFKILLDLYNRASNYEKLSTTDRVILFDECIHAEHETGDIFELDLDTMHAEVDELYE